MTRAELEHLLARFTKQSKALSEAVIVDCDALDAQLKQACADLRAEALANFIAQGLSEKDFDFRDDLCKSFDLLHATYVSKRRAFVQAIEGAAKQRVQQRAEILQVLRSLDRKKILSSHDNALEVQAAWEALPAPQLPVELKQERSYLALLQRYEARLDIVHSLKELDADKNTALQTELIEKLEKLNSDGIRLSDIAIVNQYFRTYKLWANKLQVPALVMRFEQVHTHLQAQIETLKDKASATDERTNADKKALIDALTQQLQTAPTEVLEWKKQTQLVKAAQEAWRQLHTYVRNETLHEAFWSMVKEFFKRKKAFMAVLDKSYQGNLKQKKAILEELNTLSTTDQPVETLQSSFEALLIRWKESGKVRISNHKPIHDAWKTAQNAFFTHKQTQLDNFVAEHKQELGAYLTYVDAINTCSRKKPFAIADLEELLTSKPQEPLEPPLRKQWLQQAAKPLQALLQKLEKIPPEDLKPHIETLRTLYQDIPTEEYKKRSYKINRLLRSKQYEIKQLENNQALWADTPSGKKIKAQMNQQIQALTDECAQYTGALRLYKTIIKV